jgi:TonB-linked SusC/RagA family outer membrane protein
MKKSILTIVLATLCLFLSKAGQAQTIKITGVITDQQGQTLSNATIQIVNQNIKTKSNIDGTFTINSPIHSGKLKVSYLGYHDKEILFSSSSLNRFKITLEAINDILKEIEINAGYYKVKDVERTGTITRISAETIGKQPINNPLQALQGRVAGMEIVQTTGVPGGGFNVRIRGQNSIINGNEPLYILNGIPVPSSSLSSSSINFSIIPNASPLSSINPADIESIEVLKDADATAIYGSRGANGVVLITTKRGQSGALKIDMNYNQGVGKVTRTIDFLNTAQYVAMRNEAFKNDNLTPGASDYDVNGTWDQNRNTDWQKELIGGTANTSNANLSLSGGSEMTTFLLSGSYFRESTVFPGSHNYQKKSSLLNVNHITPNQKLKLLANVSYNIEDSTLPTTDPTSSITLPPNAPRPLMPDGSLNFENGTFSFSNPLAYLKKSFYANTGTLNASGSISYLILPELEFSVRAGYTRMQRDEVLTNPLAAINPANKPTTNNRTASYADNSSQTLNIEPQLSYTLNYGNNKLIFLAGATIQTNTLHNQTLKGTGYVSDGIMKSITAASALTITNGLNSEYNYLSAFGRINYSLKDKLFINLTGRRDGSSRFGKENVYANFGAIGAAWIFSNEDLIKENLPFLTFGKLRGSYGTSGNDQIGDYNYLELWEPTTNNYQGAASLMPSRLSNPDFQWEVNRKLETALDLGFFNDKIRATTTYYQNRSSNQLVNYGLAPSTGFTYILRNLPAKVQNTGWEFELISNNISKRDFHWTTSLNVSIPKNELLAFPDLEKSFYSSIYVIGEPLNILKTLQSAGVDPQTGLYTFYDFDGSGTVSSPGDQKVIKRLGQIYSGGFQNSFSYKNWALDFLFQFVKQTGRNYQVNIPGAPGGMYNQPDIVLNRWQKPGEDTNIQKYGVNSTTLPYAYGRLYGDFSVSDASFIRLKNFSISYRHTNEQLNRLGVNSLRIYLLAQNILTITNYLGLDPESQKFNALPPLSMVSAGLQVTF